MRSYNKFTLSRVEDFEKFLCARLFLMLHIPWNIIDYLSQKMLALDLELEYIFLEYFPKNIKYL